MFTSKKNLEILKKALAIIAEEEAALLPTKEESSHITFSDEFTRKMEKLIKQQKKPYYHLINTVGKRVACIIVAALLALTTVTFSVKALREAVIDFFVEAFEQFSIVGFNDNDLPDEVDFIETYYAPTYIPEGYELKETEKFSTRYELSYVDSKDNFIDFKQNIMLSNAFYLNTENSHTQRIRILDYDALYSVEGDLQMIYWNDESYRFVLISENDLSKEELIKIAESVKPE